MKRPINVTISETADDWLRTLAVELSLPLGVVVERAILAFDGSGDAAIDQDRLATIEARLTAVETRLEAALRPIPWETDEVQIPAPAPAPSPAETRVERNQARDAAIRELWRFGSSYREIQDALFKQGIVAAGRDGQPKPISVSIISRVVADE